MKERRKVRNLGSHAQELRAPFRISRAETVIRGCRRCSYPPTGMKNINRSFNMALESSLSATLTFEAEYDAACYRSPETRQALRAFIESRKKN